MTACGPNMVGLRDQASSRDALRAAGVVDPVDAAATVLVARTMGHAKGTVDRVLPGPTPFAFGGQARGPHSVVA
jgi:hypothetical protein